MPKKKAISRNGNWFNVGIVDEAKFVASSDNGYTTIYYRRPGFTDVFCGHFDMVGDFRTTGEIGKFKPKTFAAALRKWVDEYAKKFPRKAEGSTDALAEQLVKLSKFAQQLNAGRLTSEAVELLIHHKTKVSRKAIRQVLDAAAELDKTYLKEDGDG